MRAAQTRHTLKDRGNDLYESPGEAVHALLDLGRSGEIATLPDRIWEPACGPGSIVRVLRGAGHHVTATDLVDYGARRCDDSQSGVDFLFERAMLDGTQAIITNPPFKLANEFVRHAHAIGAPRIILLLRAMFIEGSGRTDVIEDMGLRSVHVFRNRLPMMHRDGFDGPKNGSSVPFAWFDWHLDYKGPIRLGRVSWKPLP
jgi:hypothetical protein